MLLLNHHFEILCFVAFVPIIVCICPANERWCYNVMPSVIGWAHMQNYPCMCTNKNIHECWSHSVWQVILGTYLWSRSSITLNMIKTQKCTTTKAFNFGTNIRMGRIFDNKCEEMVNVWHLFTNQGWTVFLKLFKIKNAYDNLHFL